MCVGLLIKLGHTVENVVSVLLVPFSSGSQTSS